MPPDGPTGARSTSSSKGRRFALVPLVARSYGHHDTHQERRRRPYGIGKPTLDPRRADRVGSYQGDGADVTLDEQPAAFSCKHEVVAIVLSADEARVWWRALLANSVSLLEDAVSLRERGSLGRAQSLGVLAMEEMAKAHRISNAAEAAWTARSGPVTMPDEFEKNAGKHPPKLLEALLADTELEPFWGDFSATFESELEDVVEHLADAVTATQEAVQKLNLAKQAGFYVDRLDGIVRSSTETTVDELTIDLARVARVVEMLLIRDHSRMKFDMAAEDYDSTHDLQTRLLAIAH